MTVALLLGLGNRRRRKALALLVFGLYLTLLMGGCSTSADPRPQTLPAPVNSVSPSVSPYSTPYSSTAPSTSPRSTAGTTTVTSPSTPRGTTPSPTATTPPAAQRFVVDIPARFKGKDRKNAETAVGAFASMLETWDRSMQKPSAKDWVKEMGRYLTSPALNIWQQGALEPAQKHGFHQVGVTSARGQVTSVLSNPARGGTRSVTIVACVDVSAVKFLRANGDEVHQAGPRIRWVALVEDLPELGWTIRALSLTDEQGRAVAC
jgi:hypothetical protein